MTERELLDLKQKIDRAKQTADRLEARREVLMEQLKKEWKLSSIPAAQKKINAMRAEIDELDEQIKAQTEELEKQLEDERGTD